MPGTAPPMDDEADEALMLRYAAGEVAAFELLYGRHEMRVWRYLFRSVKVQALADEMLQDVWFAVARQAASYQVSARFTTWVFTIAHNRLVDHFRSAKNQVSLHGHGGNSNSDEDGSGDLEDTLAADSGFGPVRRLESREQAAALIAAVEQLAPEQREAFLLQAEAGMNVQDIARTTGVSFETAKSRLRYARSKLRQQLLEFA